MQCEIPLADGGRAVKQTVCRGIPTGCGSHMPSRYRTLIDAHTHWEAGGSACVHHTHAPRACVCAQKHRGGFCRLPRHLFPSVCQVCSFMRARALACPDVHKHAFPSAPGQTLAAFFNSCATDVERLCPPSNKTWQRGRRREDEWP